MPISTLLLLILALIVALSFAVFQYFLFEKPRVKITIVLAFLRFLSVFSILILIINPKIKNQITEIEKPILNVLVDNSTSLNDYKDNLGLILNELTTNKKLADKFDVISYQFGNQFTKLDSLTFLDTQTNVINPISQLNKVYKNNIAPIILVTDGNQNIGNSYEYFNSKQSIFPIIIGDTTNYVDVKISNINVNKYAFLNNKFPVELVVKYEGDKPINSNLTIYKGSNSVVFKKQLKLSSINSSEIIQLFLPANKIGLNNYSAVISPIKNEKNKTNNRFRFSLEVIDQQSKILIVSSILHPDLGMFKKSIETNKQRKVDIKLISNKSIQILDYQIIIVYQPNNKFKSVFNDLKSSNKNYFVISGTKTDWNFLNSNQSYYSKNAINDKENYLPKYNDNFTLFVNNDLGFDDFPPLEDSFGELKFLFPNEVLLYQNSPIKELSIPLLALINDKDVKTGILLGENSWRWRMHSYQEKQSFEPFDNYFGNIINYLTTNKKSGRLQIEAKNNYFENQPIHIIAYFYDETYQFNPNAQLSIKVYDNQNKEVLNQPFKLNENYFETNLSGLESGNYTYKVASKNEKAISRSGGFYIEDFNIEQLFTKPDVAKLTALASNSNGQIYYLNQTNLLIENLINNDEFTTLQKVVTSYQSLINWRWLLGAIILFLSAEWFIRKYHGYI